MSDTLKIDRVGALLTVEMTKAPGNHFTRGMCEELSAILISPPSGAHILHLRSSSDTFCTGRDGSAREASNIRAMAKALAEVNVALVASDLTVVAEVGGAAAGFGVGLAGLSDVTIASSNATFCFPEVRASLAPALVLAWLPHVVGRRNAFWLASTGSIFNATDAMTMGIVNEVVDPSSLSNRVNTVIDELLLVPSSVLIAIKHDLRTSLLAQMKDDSFAAADRLALRALTRTDQEPVHG